MRGLVPYAWRSLIARPARSVLTISGIAIGVAVLVAAIAVNSGLDSAVDRTVASIVGRADLRISGFAQAGLSSAAVTAIESVPGVAAVAPVIERKSFLGPFTDLRQQTDPVTIVGVDPAKEKHVRDLGLVRGKPLTGLDETAALITERLARDEGLDLASEITLLGASAPVHARIVGILAGDGPALGSGGRVVIMPIGTVQTMGLADGETAPADGSLIGVTRVDVVLADGASVDVIRTSLASAITTEPYILSSPKEMAESMRASTAGIRGTLALLASITLFAAAFLIFNTLSMTVIERIRELGLLRANGASRGQVVRVVVTQALVLGVVGSLVGILAGFALAEVSAILLRASGNINLDRPDVIPGAVIAGFAAGILVTLVAALEPARRAASVSPVIALRARSNPGVAVRARTGWLVVVMAVVGFAAIFLLPVGAGAPLGALRAIALYVILLVTVLVMPAILRPLARLAGLPFAALFRLEERLARAAIGRDRSRTTLTVGTLVVGLAMVVAMGAVQENARATATGWLKEVVPGDEVLTAIAPAPVGEGGVDEQLLQVDGVQSATPIATFDLAFKGARLDATAIRGSDLALDGRLVFLAGDRAAALAALDAGGAVIVPRDRAARLGVHYDDTLAVATQQGLVELKVVGIVQRSFPGRSGEGVLVGWKDAEEHFGVQGADAFAVRYATGDHATASAAVAELARQWALSVAPLSKIEGAVTEALDRVFGLLDLIALAAVVIAAFGIVNTLSMDTLERVREIGMLRAAGMSRRQVWRSVIVEAGILGVIGAVLGIVAGLVSGVLLVATGGGRLEDGLSLPFSSMAVAFVLGVGLAMLSAAQPARIAGGRPIVSAVRGE